MRKIDLKSFIIGVLLTIIFFMFIGMNNKSLGDIEVTSIEVKNKNGQTITSISPNEFGGGIANFNNNGELANFMGTEQGYSGTIWNENGKGVITTSISATEDGGIIMQSNSENKTTAVLDENSLLLFNENGKNNIQIAASEEGGYIAIKNKYLKSIVDIGYSNNLDGVINLSDRYGDSGWFKTGKR